MGSVVVVDGLRKRYRDLTAVDGVSFEVRSGEIFGMVGPNGAGKTTTVECMEGLRRWDEGSVRVLGLRPQEDRRELMERIGIQFQTSALPPRVRVREAMDLFSSFYRRTTDWRQLLEQVGLREKEHASFGELSGGQKQRLFVALALINDPELVFLDELTTGLDPQSRRAMWDLVAGVRRRANTVFLTTHYMEEAEHLCDRVAIMDHGQIVALDTPANLIASLGGKHCVVLEVGGTFDRTAFEGLPGVSRVEEAGGRVTVYGEREGLVSAVVNALEKRGIPFRNLRTEDPSLEDVFLALTGREMRG
ncbi:MAG: ABC transporter ATP-binding protein [Bacillota bacterium]